MVHSQIKWVSPYLFVQLWSLWKGVASSKIAISESVFSCLVCLILFGVSEMLCKSEGGGGITYVGHSSCIISKLKANGCFCQRECGRERLRKTVYVLNCIICIERMCWVNVCRFVRFWICVCVCQGSFGPALQLVPQSLTKHHVGGNLPVFSNQGCNWLSTSSPLLLRSQQQRGNGERTLRGGERDGEEGGGRGTNDFGKEISTFHIDTDISYRIEQLHTDIEVYKDW